MKVFNIEDKPIHFIDEELCVVVVTDSLTLEKSMRVHDILYRWQNDFKKINIPIYIVTPNRMEWSYSDWFTYVYSPDYSCFKELQAYKKKNVYGKDHWIVYSYIFVYQDGKIVDQVKRITNKSVGNLYLKLLEIRYKEFVKKIQKRFDNNI